MTYKALLVTNNRSLKYNTVKKGRRAVGVAAGGTGSKASKLSPPSPWFPGPHLPIWLLVAVESRPSSGFLLFPKMHSDWACTPAWTTVLA